MFPHSYRLLLSIASEALEYWYFNLEAENLRKEILPRGRLNALLEQGGKLKSELCLVHSWRGSSFCERKQYGCQFNSVIFLERWWSIVRDSSDASSLCSDLHALLPFLNSWHFELIIKRKLYISSKLRAIIKIRMTSQTSMLTSSLPWW
jgi:hypothetical protein